MTGSHEAYNAASDALVQSPRATTLLLVKFRVAGAAAPFATKFETYRPREVQRLATADLRARGGRNGTRRQSKNL